MLVNSPFAGTFALFESQFANVLDSGWVALQNLSALTNPAFAILNVLACLWAALQHRRVLPIYVLKHVDVSRAVFIEFHN
jgi:hypothetical protein